LHVGATYDIQLVTFGWAPGSIQSSRKLFNTQIC
jgi:hypothetical protein